MSCPRLPSVPAERRGQVMVGNNLVAPGSIPLSAQPPPASRKNRRVWFSSPASPVEHNWGQWRMESSLDLYLESIQTHFMFPRPCWFSILSSLFTPKKLWKSCVEESCLSRQHCVMKAASPFWVGLVQVHLNFCWGTQFWSSWLSWPPSTPEVGGTAVEQLCRTEFAKSRILPYCDF